MCTVGSELLDVCVTHRPVGRKKEFLQIREFACEVCEAACAALERRTPTKVKFFQKLAARSQFRDPAFSYVFTSPQIQTAKLFAFCSHHACYKVIVFNLQGKQTLGHVQHHSRNMQRCFKVCFLTHITHLFQAFVIPKELRKLFIAWYSDLLLQKTKIKQISYKPQTQLFLNSFNSEDKTAEKVVSLKKLFFFAQLLSP